MSNSSSKSKKCKIKKKKRPMDPKVSRSVKKAKTTIDKGKYFNYSKDGHKKRNYT